MSKKRKSPIKHSVKKHDRKNGARVKQHVRGSGSRVGRTKAQLKIRTFNKNMPLGRQIRIEATAAVDPDDLGIDMYHPDDQEKMDKLLNALNVKFTGLWEDIGSIYDEPMTIDEYEQWVTDGPAEWFRGMMKPDFKIDTPIEYVEVKIFDVKTGRLLRKIET